MNIKTLDKEKIRSLEKVKEKYSLKWKPEIIEVADGVYDYSGYPDPLKRYHLVKDSFNASIEESYFWIMNFLKHSLEFPYIEKIYDFFSSSEASSMWGVTQQRLGIQQDKVSSYMAIVGKMIKELFQIVRELRIIDERLNIYKRWGSEKSADVSLKGIYIDLVEGGAKNPSSVYGIAQNVGFTILPDLFFNTHIYDEKDVDRVVDSLPYPKNVKNVLKRKLMSFISWTKATHKELEVRRKYTIKYLLEHWASIKMYISWIKPYVLHIKRLTGSIQQLNSADLVAAFETAMIDIEFLAKKPLQIGNKSYYSCILATFQYRTKPQMLFQQEYQRGPIHMGNLEINLRSYLWTNEEIKAYKEMRDMEDMEIMGIFDRSITAAMEALGEDLKKYLEEAEVSIGLKKSEKKKENKDRQREGIMDPFTALFKGFLDLGKIFLPTKRKKVEKENAPEDPGLNKILYVLYKMYKNTHGMVSW